MLTLSTEGIDEIQSYLDNMDAVQLNDIKDTVVQYIMEETEARFYLSPSTTRGGVVYPEEEMIEWEPLKASTLKRKPKRKFGQILIDTEDLRRSVTIPGFNNYTEVINNKLEFTTFIPYSQFHPTRPYLFFSKQLIDKITDYLQGYISNQNNINN